MNKIKIAVVDDQQLFREGLIALLDTEEFEVVAQAGHGKELLELLPTLPEHPEILLLDMNMPEMNGLELTQILQKQAPHIKIIILTVHDQERYIYKMIEMGTSGYLLKNCDMQELTAAVRAVHTSGFYFNERIRAAMQNSSKYKGMQLKNVNNIPVELTDREIEILRLVCKEHTNAEIAEMLNISVRTVDGHRNNLLLKTGCRNAAGLVLFAINNNLYNTIPS